MRNVYAAEMYRLKRTKSSYIVLLIYTIAVAINVLLAISNNSMSIALAGESNASIFMMIAMVGIATSTFETHTFKNMLSSGNSRKDIYLGKLLCAATITLVYIVVAIIGAIIGFAVYACTNGGFNMEHLGGSDGNIGDVILKMLLACVTMALFAFLFFGIAMFSRTSKMSYNVCVFVSILLPLLQGMIAAATQVSLIGEINLTLDLGARLSEPHVSWTVYLSTAIFIAAGVVSNILAYSKMKKTED